MMEFFNISKSRCHKHFKNLGIKYESHSGTSYYEDDILEFLESIGIESISRNTKQIISPRELDFFFQIII